MTAKVSCFSLLQPRQRHGETSRCSVPVICGNTFHKTRPINVSGVNLHTLKVAEIDIDNLPFAIDDTESVPEGLEDVSVNADKSVFVDCSKAGAELVLRAFRYFSPIEL